MKFSNLQLRNIYALGGLSLSLGAPLGFLVHSYIFNSPHLSFIDHIQYMVTVESSTLLYITFGTMFFFTGFGFFLGKKSEKAIHDAEKINQILSELSLVQSSKANFLNQMMLELSTPASFGLEFLNSLEQGHIGKISEQEKEILWKAQSELLALTNKLNKIISLKNLTPQNITSSNVLTFLKIIENDFKNFNIEQKIGSIDHQLIEFDQNLIEMCFELLKTSLPQDEVFSLAIEHINDEDTITFLSSSSALKLKIYHPTNTTIFRGMSSMGISLLREIIEGHSGFIIENQNELIICLPLKDSKLESKRAA
jgi:hypothetical protein